MVYYTVNSGETIVPNNTDNQYYFFFIKQTSNFGSYCRFMCPKRAFLAFLLFLRENEFLDDGIP